MKWQDYTFTVPVLMASLPLMTQATLRGHSLNFDEKQQQQQQQQRLLQQQSLNMESAVSESIGGAAVRLDGPPRQMMTYTSDATAPDTPNPSTTSTTAPIPSSPPSAITIDDSFSPSHPTPPPVTITPPPTPIGTTTLVPDTGPTNAVPPGSLTCPTPLSQYYQNVGGNVRACNSNSDCAGFFSSDGETCCLHPQCICGPRDSAGRVQCAKDSVTMIAPIPIIIIGPISITSGTSFPDNSTPPSLSITTSPTIPLTEPPTTTSPTFLPSSSPTVTTTPVTITPPPTSDSPSKNPTSHPTPPPTSDSPSKSPTKHPTPPPTTSPSVFVSSSPSSKPSTTDNSSSPSNPTPPPITITPHPSSHPSAITIDDSFSPTPLPVTITPPPTPLGTTTLVPDTGPTNLPPDSLTCPTPLSQYYQNVGGNVRACNSNRDCAGIFSSDGETCCLHPQCICGPRDSTGRVQCAKDSVTIIAPITIIIPIPTEPPI